MREITRREMLASAIATGAAGVAGCLTRDGGTDGGQHESG